MLIAARNAMMAGKRLPYDAEVEYLESTGTQWIDTGIVANLDTWFETDVFFSGEGCPFSSRISSSSNRYGVSSTVQYGLFVNNGDGDLNQWLVADRSSFVGKRYSLRLEDKRLWVNGELNPDVKGIPFDAGVNLYAFALNQSNAAIQLFHGRIYSLRFYGPNGDLRDFIPVRKGTVGYLYDRVSGKLFGNAGTGAFTFGNDLKHPIPAA